MKETILFKILTKKKNYILILSILMVSCKIMKNYNQLMTEKYEMYKIENLEKKINIDEMIEDIDFLAKTLEEVHPNLYSSISKDSFFTNIDKIKSSLPKTDALRNFYKKIAPIVVEINHDHTHVQFPWNAYNNYLSNKGKIFPFNVYIKNERIIIKDCYSGNTNLVGKEISSINGIESKKIIDELLKYCYGSTYYSKINKRLNNNFSPLLWMVYDFKEPYHIICEKKEYTLNGATSAEINYYYNNKKASGNSVNTEFKYQNLNNKIGLLIVNNFEQEDFKKKLKSAFLAIKKDEISDLILDVRNNTGGNTIQIKQLIGYLQDNPYKTSSYIEQRRSIQFDKFLDEIFYNWIKPFRKFHPLLKQYYNTQIGQNAKVYMKEKKPKRNPLRFNRNLYVLIGPNNYSSGTEFVSIIKDYNMGIIIGQETGSPANEYGNPYEFVLPNSNLWVRCATNYTIRPSGEKTIGGIQPDIYLNNLEGELENEKDIILGYTIKFILDKRN